MERFDGKNQRNVDVGMLEKQVSNEQKGPWLGQGYIGDEKLPSYIGIIINHNKDPY